MKLFYEISILASLMFYSTLSIALLGPWMYGKIQPLMAAGRRRNEKNE